MPPISTLKEKFAFAKTPEERMQVIRQHAVTGSSDWYYYRGLTLLAQLEETLTSAEPREPTSAERELVASIHELLRDYCNNYNNSNYRKLNTRFQLLRYPLDPTATLSFIRERFGLSNEDTMMQQGEAGTPKPARRIKPGDFDPTVISPAVVLDRALGLGNKISPLVAFPSLKDVYDPEKEHRALRELLSYPHSDTRESCDIVQRLNHTLGNKKAKVDSFNINNFTIEQMERLMETHKDFSIVQKYITKLGDDLERVWAFVKELPAGYSGIKVTVLFYKLKETLICSNFNDFGLFEMYWKLRNERFTELKWFPVPPYSQRTELVDAYLAGALIKNPSLSLAHLENYESELKRTHATILLTRVPATSSQEYWRNVLGSSEYRNLVDKTELCFGYPTLYSKEATTTLHITVKNIPHVSIRVFAIDLQQYWRLHPSATDIQVDNVDGLCPTWEKQLDYSHAEPVQVIEDTIDLEKLAPEVFSSRGAWVVDLMGERESSRVIIQKGRLRHIWKNTSAGHLFRIFDEENATVENAKIWYRNEYYEADDDHNILIPYNTKAEVPSQMLIVHEEFCEPLRFTCKEERYDLTINCYVNPESLAPNRQTKVVVSPRVTIHDQAVPLQLLESVKFTVDATNSDGVQSTFTQHVSKASQSMEFQFTVPSTLQSLTFHLRGQVKSADGTTTHDVAASDTTTFSSMQKTTSAYLKTDTDGYYILILGKNGEPKRNADVHIELQHRMLLANKPIEQKLRANDDGIVQLGKLDNITCVSITLPVRKTWPLLAQNPQLPRRMHQQANAPFRIPGTFIYSSLFQTLDNSNVIHDFTGKLNMHATYIDIEGLPEGTYRLNLESKGGRSSQITCNIIASGNQQQQGSHWSHWADWLLGKETFAQATPAKPLSISSIAVADKQVTVKLDNAKSSARAIVTASTFVAENQVTIARLLRNLPTPKLLDAPLNTQLTFMTGRKLSEEFQYVLNRARAEKWVGSSLTKPSLLVYPDEKGSTTTRDRDLGLGKSFTSTKNAALCHARGERMDGLYGSYQSDLFNARPTTDMAFLNHRCPSLILTPDEDGVLTIDRSQLGDGNILHVAIQQGEQVLIEQLVLEDASQELKCNNLCQQGDPSKLCIQSKAVKELLPQEQLILNLNNEWELVDTFEKLFTLFENMGSISLEDVKFLNRWPSYTDEEKLKKHEKVACHELNLWIKYKDTAFFDKHIKPYVEAKLYKSFMDLYLIDDLTGLRKFVDSVYLYKNLSTVEKALLAKRFPELLPITLQAFKDADINQSDVNFDTVLAGSALQVEQEPIAISEMALPPPPPPPGAPSGFGFGSAIAAGATASAYHPPVARSVNLFGSSAPPLPPGASGAMRKRMLAAKADSSSEQEESDEDMGFSLMDDGDFAYEDDDVIIEQVDQGGDDEPDEEDQLRAALRKRKSKKVPFRFTQQTKEWAEKGYYNDYNNTTPVNKFWIDYLESDGQKPFLSGNFIFATNSFTEIMFALALSELPFQSQCKQESDVANHKIVITAETPCLVFHRQLKEAPNDPPENPTILLGQNFYVNQDQHNMNHDELEMVDPNDLEPGTEYGWHVAISNVSSKRCSIEVTLQVPVGAIPTGKTPYCHSRTLELLPYSTWQSVVGSFYFPSCGEFGQFPVTVSQKSKLVGATPSLKIHVKTPDITSGTSSWTTLASSGTEDQVITHLLQSNLDKVNFELLRWRLNDPPFATRVIDTLRKRRFYSMAVWQYGLYHQFTDAIKELLENEEWLVNECGTAFESPLVSTSLLKLTSLLEYAPVIPARQHQLGLRPEIRNSELHASYTNLLDYLGEKREASTQDLLVLTVYLILQERIGEAKNIYERINSDGSMQYDYLGAYLETRVRADQVEPATLDLSNVRQVAKKYTHCSQVRWRKIFTSLLDYVDEIERQQQKDDSTEMMPERQQAQAILNEPVLDFDLEQDQLVLRYSKVQQVEIRYYKTDVEVMFSHNPFNRSSDAGWVKPHVIQKIDLDAQETTAENDLEPYEVIGIGKANIKTHRVSLPSNLTHAIVQVNGGGLKRSKPYFEHTLLVHFVESYGMVRVADKAAQRPIAGAYVKVYARFKNTQVVEFWKDGYTGLNGVFDYVNVTDASLDKLQKVDKFSLLISSAENGALVEETYPPASF
ncbi:hypothetical protein BJV82DRAFT_717646 [Fennellomyces sp. T-0311]|nr:hypothetical protein BJV82DRAFT_717646 [Fennellomyces sp. T-0311]